MDTLIPMHVHNTYVASPILNTICEDYKVFYSPWASPIAIIAKQNEVGIRLASTIDW